MAETTLGTSHLALAYNPVGDPLVIEGRQQVRKGSALANLLRNQWGQLVDIVFATKARARIDHQAGKAIILRQADLQNAEIPLQPLLLVDHQLEPAALDRLNGIAGHIETGGVDVTWLLASGFQIGLHGARQVAVIGHH